MEWRKEYGGDVCFNELYYRYDAALERKKKILETIRSLDLPNNPLDDIIDQVVVTRLCILLLKKKKIYWSLYSPSFLIVHPPFIVVFFWLTVIKLSLKLTNTLQALSNCWSILVP